MGGVRGCTHPAARPPPPRGTYSPGRPRTPPGAAPSAATPRGRGPAACSARRSAGPPRPAPPAPSSRGGGASRSPRRAPGRAPALTGAGPGKGSGGKTASPHRSAPGDTTEPGGTRGLPVTSRRPPRQQPADGAGRAGKWSPGGAAGNVSGSCRSLAGRGGNDLKRGPPRRVSEGRRGPPGPGPPLLCLFFFSQVPERRAPGQAEQPSPRACKASFGACRGPAALRPQARPGGAGVSPLPRREGPRRGLGVSKRREGPERA